MTRLVVPSLLGAFLSISCIPTPVRSFTRSLNGIHTPPSHKIWRNGVFTNKRIGVSFGTPNQQSAPSPASSLSCTTSDENDTAMGLNEIQTLLREAVSAEKYKEAARLRDLLASRMDRAEDTGHIDPSSGKGKSRSWTGMGTAPWLVDRLESTNFTLPTTIQIHTMLSINAILSDRFDGADGGDGSDEGTLEERLALTTQTTAESEGGDDNLGVVISGSTGSGKSLAFLVPMLSTLSESLFTRQRIRVKTEEDILDVADDLLARVARKTSPEVLGRGISGGGKVESLGKSGKDVRSPLALIVVPTRELGAQTAMLVYGLVGGNSKRGKFDFSGKANMFKYKGPRGVKIGCILDDETSVTGLKLQTDIAITTPKYLTKLLQDGDVDPNKLRTIIFDEADLALEQTSQDDLIQLFAQKHDQEDLPKDDDFEDDVEPAPKTLITYLVGASVTDALGGLSQRLRHQILPENKSYIATAEEYAPLTFSDNTPNLQKKSIKDLRLLLDPGLVHERCVAPKNTGLLCLCRMLRKELQEHSALLAQNSTALRTPPRVVIFFPSEEEAKKATVKLRDAMWGDYKLCVLLPDTGVNPLQIMEQFQQNQTSIMLATPNSVRGLDFQDLTHVYTLYLPANDPREYLHLAGRVGRIGQRGSSKGAGGKVTSILSEEDGEKMDGLAQDLGFKFKDVQFAKDGGDEEFLFEEDDKERTVDVERMRRYLEDKLTLLDNDDENGQDNMLGMQ